MITEERIRGAVEKALEAVGAPHHDVAFVVERPTEIAHGDYATNAAMVAAKVVGKNPRELAEELAVKIGEDLGESASRVEIAGPGFINITL